MMHPLTFHPLIKRIRWGGRRLGDLLGKPIGAGDDYAESWEICDHGEDQSRVVTGEFAGWTLQQLVQQQAAALFGERSNRDQFPLLIKYLDCNDRLSVQVHPDDRLAKAFDPLENGKTEAWVVMQAEPGSVIYAGMRDGVTEAELRNALTEGTAETLLHRIEPTAGDCFFIPAGTVHALGEGVLVAEVQQSSDLTFRLHDWGRVDREGHARPLHLEEAIRCIDFNAGPVRPVTPQLVAETDSMREEFLVECPYFTMRRLEVRGRTLLEQKPVCRILMGLQGAGTWASSTGKQPFSQGQTLLVPAECAEIELMAESAAPWKVLVAEVA